MADQYSTFSKSQKLIAWKADDSGASENRLEIAMVSNDKCNTLALRH